MITGSVNTSYKSKLMGSTKQLLCKEFTFNKILVLELFGYVDLSASGGVGVGGESLTI